MKSERPNPATCGGWLNRRNKMRNIEDHTGGQPQVGSDALLGCLADWQVPLGPKTIVRITVTGPGKRPTPEDMEALIEVSTLFKRQMERAEAYEASHPNAELAVGGTSEHQTNT